MPNDPATGQPVLGDRPEEGIYYLDREVFKAHTLYFAFDSSAVKPEEKPKIDAVAAYLKSHSTCKVKVEGHCDERGTDGYNLALGERRALSAREALIAAGIPGDHISTITFGEGQPAVLGHDEPAYAKNRRAEFVLLTPKTQ